MLRSWEFRTKHLPLAERQPAVGIVDGDGEGDRAHDGFVRETVGWKHVSLIRLSRPAHLADACDLGVNIPVCLEELWPAGVWQTAHQRGWLSARPKKGLVGETLLQRLAEQDERLSDLIDDAWRPFFERRVNTAPDLAKVDWAAHMAGLPRGQIEPLAAEPLKVLDEAIAKLGI